MAVPAHTARLQTLSRSSHRFRVLHMLEERVLAEDNDMIVAPVHAAWVPQSVVGQLRELWARYATTELFRTFRLHPHRQSKLAHVVCPSAVQEPSLNNLHWSGCMLHDSYLRGYYYGTEVRHAFTIC